MLENETGGKAEVEPIDNRLFVLVLQHPQEKREVLATAAETCAALRRAALVVGLSWPNLARPLGRPADAGQWAVLYLGSARPAAFGVEREIIVLDRAGMPAADQDAMARRCPAQRKAGPFLAAPSNDPDRSCPRHAGISRTFANVIGASASGFNDRRYWAGSASP